MLVLSRREKEKVFFPSLGISIEVVQAKGNTIRLGINAPRDIRVLRGELVEREHSEPESNPHANAMPNTQETILANPCQRTLQQKLSEVNLAIHLAQNQLIQGLSDHAETALDQALLCVEELEEVLKQTRTPTNPQLVKEASPNYRIDAAKPKSKPNHEPCEPPGKPFPNVVLLHSNDESILDEVCSLLDRDDLEIHSFKEAKELVRYLELHQPAAAVMTDIVDIEKEQNSVPETISIPLPGKAKLEKQVKQISLGKFLANMWVDCVSQTAV